jgi:uncharacterized protein YjdB
MNFNFMVPIVRKPGAIFLITSLLALSGCGGGSASTTSTENKLPSPVAGSIDGEVLVPAPSGKSPELPAVMELLPQVSVGQRQFADPNVLLNLRGTVVAADGSDIVKTLWTQVTGPQVTIPSPLALENVILMPDVNVATQLEFRLTAEDGEGRVNSATVSILIKPVPTFVKVVGGVFNEADESAVFIVHLNAPNTMPVIISYATQNGTATNEGDYEFTSGEITLAPGEVIAEIPVVLINDVAEENDESFSLQVTAIDGEVSRANTGVAIIRNGIEPQLSQTITFPDAGPVSLYPGQEYSLSAEAPGTGAIIYSSSNSSVASVDAQGKVVGLTTGTAQITATKLADGIYLSATNSYSVQVALLAQAIQFTNSGPVSIYSAQEYTNVLNALGSGTGAIIYSSSNPAVASVDAQGKVVGLTAGTAQITATKLADNVYLSTTNSYDVQVVLRAQTIQFTNSGPVSIYAAQEFTNVLNASGSGTGAIIYSSSNPAVASVDAQGKVVGLTSGTAQITATKLADNVYLSATNSYSVQVALRAQTIQFTNSGPVSIYSGQEYTNVLNVLGSGTGAIIYSSSDSSIASVDARGKVAGLAVGTAQITATKLADKVYLAATNSFTVRVISRGATPTVSFEKKDGYSVQSGYTNYLVGYAFDVEDGSLPAEQQIAESSAIGEPNDALRWESNIDGFVSFGDTLNTASLSQGTHLITYAVTDSDGNTGTATIKVLVGNIAPDGRADASTTFCPRPNDADHCYFPYRINDQSLSTKLGGLDSWVNDTQSSQPWVSLSWWTEVTIDSIDLYTTEGYILRDYDIEYWAGESWIPIISITGNTALYRSHPISTITTSQLRVLVRYGSVEQPASGRVNELVVFGVLPPPAPAPE